MRGGQALRAAVLLGLLLVAGRPARSEDADTPLPLAGRPTPDLVQAYLRAKGAALRALERELRRRAAPVAAVARAARAQADAAGRARLKRLLGRLELDWHRARRPEGMVYVPAGMVEQPRAQVPWGPSGTRVRLAAFYIDRTEVTVAAWRAWLLALEEASPGTLRRMGIGLPPASVRADLPIGNVRWRDARRFAREVRAGRLPTAAEFERALRGSSISTWPWGEDVRKGHANLRGFGPGQPLPVGSYPRGAGPFGALDLVGNVAEWSSTEVRQGRRGVFPLVLGGSYADEPDAALAWRGKRRMQARLGHDERSPTVGFRVVRDPPKLP